MKKISKRLSLNRETLRGLDKGHLEAVNGGWPTDASCVNSCDPISARICPTTPCTTADCG